MVSLALNWSPPDSSPLFDDSGVEGNKSPSTSATNSTTPTSTKTTPSVSPDPKTSSSSVLSATAGSSSKSPSASLLNGSASSGLNTPAFSSSNSTTLAPSSAPSRAASTSPQPRSYAQAAEQPTNGRSNSIPSTQEQQRMFQQQQHHHPMPYRMGSNQFSAFAHQPGFPQAGFGHSPNLYFPGQAPSQQNNQFAWAQYQQMLAAQSRHYHSQDPPSDGSLESRRRATSGPQRPQQMNHNDNMQPYPGTRSGFTPARSNSAQSHSLPPGAMAPPSSHSVNTSNSSSQGFHPYRRGPSRVSDTGFPAAGSGAATAAAAAAAAAAAHLPPPSRPRTRTASTNSSGSERSGTASERAGPQHPQPNGSYSSVTSNSLRGAGVGGSLSVSSSPSRGGPPVIQSKSLNRPDGPIRTESASTATSVHTASTSRPYHGRAESFSSASSQQSSERALQSSMSGTGNTSTQGSGRSTPTPGIKKPSPLSHSGAADRVGEEEDADTNASYGGSDEDVGGRTTPIPGSRGKEKDPSKKSGLSGKLRKALSFNALPDGAPQPEPSGGGRAGTLPHRRGPSGLPPGMHHSSADTNGSSGSARSTSPPRTPDNGASPLPNSSSGASISSRRSNRPPLSGSGDGSGKRSIFNRKFNSSTDNISISSTVSSASVMLRKVGNLGKMARRHSLMGLTNMFNKDKDGREGLQDDSFGTAPAFASSSGALGEEPGISSKKEKKNKSKKGAPVAASISHATVELESGNDGNGAMTSAASYARQHQAAAAKAEAEARAQREKAEAEAKLNAAKKGKTADDVMESRQKAIEKEKERLKSKRGWRKKLGGGSVSSITSESSPTGLETTYAQAAANATAPALTGGNDVSSGYGGYSSPEPSSGYAQQQQQQSYEDPNNSSFDAAFDDEELEPPHMPGAGGGAEDSGDEYETDSLRHWGEGIERSRASAQSVSSVKSILKNQANPNGPGSGPPIKGKNAPPSAADRPFAGRVRANSYDAQPSSAIQSSGPHHAPLMNQMSNTPAGVDRMDGVPRSASTSEHDHGSGVAKTDDDETRTVASVSSHSGTPVTGSDPPMGHHSNASMPTLSLMLGSPTSTSAPRAVGGEKRRIAFAEQQIYHSTWPAHVYDRRGELATCNRLTPLLAQRIKEELNTYKMEEMQVAASSRIHTHFFV